MSRVLTACALLWFGCAQPALARDGSPDAVHQLRIYEIFEHNKQAFHERFRDHAARIMARYGFRIIAMWETRARERTEFVYLLEWPDVATMQIAGEPSWRIRSGPGSLLSQRYWVN